MAIRPRSVHAALPPQLPACPLLPPLRNPGERSGIRLMTFFQLNVEQSAIAHLCPPRIVSHSLFISSIYQSVVVFALQLIYISVLFRPRAYEYAAFSAVSRVAVAGCSGAVSEASAHKILISESFKSSETFGNQPGPLSRCRRHFHTLLLGL